MEATYAEFEEWSEQGVSDTIKHHYKKALQQMEKRKPFEESLVSKMRFLALCQTVYSSSFFFFFFLEQSAILSLTPVHF